MNTSFRYAAIAALIGTALNLAVSVPVLAEDDEAVETITIIGEQEDVLKIPGSAHIISDEELEKFEYTDVNRALRQIPGVYIQEEDGFGLRPNIGIRGTGTERSGRITLMEDGVLIAPAPYAASSAYYFPTFGRINGVEVLKGPASIQHGPFTVGGAINFLSTPIPLEASGKLTVETGSFAAQRLHGYYGDSGENFGWLIETHQDRSDGFKGIDRDSSDAGLRKQDWLVKFRVNSDADAAFYQQLDLKLQYAKEDSDQSYLGLTDADFSDDAYRAYGLAQLDNIDVEHDQLVLSYYAEPSDATTFKATAYRNNTKRNWFKTEGLDLDGSTDAQSFSRTSWFNVIQEVNTGGALASTYQAILDGADTAVGSIQLRSNNREYYSQGIDFQFGYDFSVGSADHELLIGYRYHEDEEDRLQRNSTYHQEGGRLVLDDFGLLGNAGNRVQEAEAHSVFIYDTITMGDWTVSPGVRFEDIELSRRDYGRQPIRDAANLRARDNSESVVLPGLGVVYQATDSVILLGGVHKGFSPPGNSPDTDAEESWNYEAGIRYTADSFYTEVVGFYNDYENILGECTNQTGGSCDIDDQGEKFNGNGASVTGLEWLLSANLSGESAYDIPLKFSYTYTDAEFESTFDSDFFGNVSKGDPIPNIPENQWFGSIGYEQGKVAMYVSATYIDESCIRASCGQFLETDDQLIIDAAAHYQLTESTNVYLAVDNLTGEEDIVGRQPYGARPSKDTSFKVGITIDF